jgi:hypothetical protein
MTFSAPVRLGCLQISERLHCADARCSEFLDLAAAKATADVLNGNRGAAEGYYFKIYRLATPSALF